MSAAGGEGRTHLITGARSGIGHALARLLAARGDRLILVLRSRQGYDDLAATLLAEGADSVSGVELDLADVDAVLDQADLLGRQGDPLDSVLHCAGVVDLASLADADPSSWQRQVQVNLLAPALLTSRLLPRLRTGRGTVVFVNSTAALQANAGWSAYAAAKAGLRAVADSLRDEESAHGVRVTTVFPSRTATAMQERVHALEGKAYQAEDWMSAETVAGAIVAALDLPADATMPEVILRTAR